MGIHEYISDSSNTVKGGSFIQSDRNNNISELHLQPKGGDVIVGLNKDPSISQTFRINGNLDIIGTLTKDGAPVDFRAIPTGETAVSWYRQSGTENIYHNISGTQQGKVGIGTNTPATKLEVIGDISSNHNLTVYY